jgi:quercetin dioxygenase-like cupin family protein
MAACLAAVRAVPAPRAADLLDDARELLSGLGSAVLEPFLRDWPAAGIPGSPVRTVVPAAVPVLRWLPDLRALAPAVSAALVDAVVTAAPSLTWRRSYTAEEVGAVFYDNYGWTEFAGLTGPVPSDRLACGALLLGPRVTYPAHRHEAEEVYVPLAGTALWRHGAGSWHERQPGEVIHHARGESHSMRTQHVPLLALYLWRSRDLAQKSQLVAPRS